MLEILDWIKGLLFLLLAISVLVVAHEFGHFSAAKLLKMRVDDFSLFFGKVLWRIGKRGDTVYNIRSVPIGGMVMIAGMDPEDIANGRPLLQALRTVNPDDPAALEAVLKRIDNDTLVGAAVERIGAQVRRSVRMAVGEDGRLTAEGRAGLESTVAGGVLSQEEARLIELVLLADDRAGDPAIFCHRPLLHRAAVILAGPVASLLFGMMLFCVMGMSIGLPSEPLNRVAETTRDGEARRVGLRSGDAIVSIDGRPVRNGREMIEKIHSSANQVLTLVVDRSGRRFEVRVTPKPKKLDMGKGKMETVGLIGITPLPGTQRVGVVESVRVGSRLTVLFVRQVFSMLGSRKQVQENVGGPIAMGQAATVVQRLGPGPMIMMTAQFSLSAGVLNLLPIPILDGGHLLMMAAEKLRRRRFSRREMSTVQFVGAGVLAMLFLFVMFNDIARTIAKVGPQ